MLAAVLLVGGGVSACANQPTVRAADEPAAAYVYFASNVDIPLDGQGAAIEFAASALDQDPWLRVVIVGHTDSDGEPDYNS